MNDSDLDAMLTMLRGGTLRTHLFNRGFSQSAQETCLRLVEVIAEQRERLVIADEIERLRENSRTPVSCQPVESNVRLAP